MKAIGQVPLRGLGISFVVVLAGSCAQVDDRGPTPRPTEVSGTQIVTQASEDNTTLPDLVMDYSWQVKYTSDCPWGGPGYVIMRGRNIGPVRASEFHIRVWDQLTPIGGLEPGEEAEARADFDSGPVGSIPAMIDSEQEVEESDEGNNEVLIVFTPPPRCTPDAND